MYHQIISYIGVSDKNDSTFYNTLLSLPVAVKIKLEEQLVNFASWILHESRNNQIKHITFSKDQTEFAYYFKFELAFCTL